MTKAAVGVRQGGSLGWGRGERERERRRERGVSEDATLLGLKM